MTDKTYSTIEAQASYGVGRQLGEQLAANSFDGIEIAAVQEGLADAMNKLDSKVTREELQVAFAEVSKRIEEARKAESAEQIQAGEAYLAEVAKREGVQVTESGLHFEIIEEGEGESPTTEDTIRAHYEGRFPDGQVFDSSIARGEPAEFPVSGVIAGWTEALQMMKPGSKYRLYVPHNLAYGERGAGAAIPPYATLEFDVELIAIL